jgi:hypothetical protein
LKDIELLRPIPYEKIRRATPTKISADRTEISLIMGALIAQGFALVDAQNTEDIEDLARGLLRHARGLSVLEEIMPRASSLAESGLAGDWDKLKEELTAAQTDAEKALLALRDEEIAHLISTGGWLRGLEIVSESILSNYSEERAEMLRKPDLLSYFNDRLETLHPDILQTKIVQTALAEIAKIRPIIEKPVGEPITSAEVAIIRDASKQIMDTLLGNKKAKVE